MLLIRAFNSVIVLVVCLVPLKFGGDARPTPDASSETRLADHSETSLAPLPHVSNEDCDGPEAEFAQSAQSAAQFNPAGSPEESVTFPNAPADTAEVAPQTPADPIVALDPTAQALSESVPFVTAEVNPVESQEVSPALESIEVTQELASADTKEFLALAEPKSSSAPAPKTPIQPAAKAPVPPTDKTPNQPPAKTPPPPPAVTPPSVKPPPGPAAVPPVEPVFQANPPAPAGPILAPIAPVSVPAAEMPPAPLPEVGSVLIRPYNYDPDHEWDYTILRGELPPGMPSEGALWNHHPLGAGVVTVFRKPAAATGGEDPAPLGTGSNPPVPAAFGPHMSYEEAYAAVGFRRGEYEANPSYRHEAAMELMFGAMRPTVISKQTIPYFSRYPDLFRYRYPTFPYPNGFGQSSSSIYRYFPVTLP